MQGLHLTADLRGCSAGALLSDADVLRALCLAEVQAAGLTPVDELFHPFGAGQGVTGVVLLAESHVALHTWPELQAVTLDVYVCNLGADNSVRARALLDRLLAAFGAERVERHELHRG
ncbi:MAG TPA: adenosylmethionine decarboxylase [Burkholderiaceae bacterium]|jgi:S-adenosylmethionine decarboxylase|nr:adenosylmethionine decarboxylase [Chloroflexota bacterium]HEV8315113.1 adenosylmethionine decarboxylase [Burkholderiaceae bacterium]